MKTTTQIDELADAAGAAVAELLKRVLHDVLERIPNDPRVTNAHQEPKLMTAAEVSTLLRISRKTVYRDANSGRLPSVRFGRRVLFESDALDAYRNAARSNGHRESEKLESPASRGNDWLTS